VQNLNWEKFLGGKCGGEAKLTEACERAIITFHKIEKRIKKFT
jgi:molybdate transport system regulatory protein